MKFLVDAHLPPRLREVHTQQLPDQNATKDRIINQLSLAEERIVISNESDFSTRICYKAASGNWCW